MEEKKKYPQGEEHNEQNVSEPAFEYITDEELRPCTFTLEELEKEIAEAHKDINEGRVYTTEELRIIHPI